MAVSRTARYLSRDALLAEGATIAGRALGQSLSWKPNLAETAMSDHIDDPRQIGDPSADLTDLFAFTSPENPARTVLAANVFPTCGNDAIFSNAIIHAIVVRRAKVAGIGEATKFETSDPEIRFSVRFDALERGAAGQAAIQRGTCTFPDGQTLRIVVNDEKGASTISGLCRLDQRYRGRIFRETRPQRVIDVVYLSHGGILRLIQRSINGCSLRLRDRYICIERAPPSTSGMLNLNRMLTPGNVAQPGLVAKRYPFAIGPARDGDSGVRPSIQGGWLGASPGYCARRYADNVGNIRDRTAGC
jgi:hypothetical protein